MLSVGPTARVAYRPASSTPTEFLFLRNCRI